MNFHPLWKLYKEIWYVLSCLTQLAQQILNGIYRGGCRAEAAAAGGVRAFWLLYLTLFSKKEALRNDGE